MGQQQSLSDMQLTDVIKYRVDDFVKQIWGELGSDVEEMSRYLFENWNYFDQKDAAKIEQDLKKFWYDLELKMAHNKIIDENDEKFEQKVFEAGYDPTAKDVEAILGWKMRSRDEAGSKVIEDQEESR